MSEGPYKIVKEFDEMQTQWRWRLWREYDGKREYIESTAYGRLAISPQWIRTAQARLNTRALLG